MIKKYLYITINNNIKSNKFYDSKIRNPYEIHLHATDKQDIIQIYATLLVKYTPGFSIHRICNPPVPFISDNLSIGDAKPQVFDMELYCIFMISCFIDLAVLLFFS